MKYVAVCVLSVVTMLSASASPAVSAVQLFPTTLEVRGVVDELAPMIPDSLLMTLLGGALIALQLRRRQKSMRSPRLAILSS